MYLITHLIICVIFFVSCGTPHSISGSIQSGIQKNPYTNLDKDSDSFGTMKMRNTQEYFTVSDVETYFLPNLPTWANFSEMAQCSRSGDIRFLDIPKIHHSFNLNYSEIINMQLSFNVELEIAKKEKKILTIPLKEHANIFFSVSDKISSQIYEFNIPNFPLVDIIWIDPIVDDTQKIFEILKDEKRHERFPIIISSCLKTYDLQRKIIQVFKESNQNTDNLSFKYLGAEMFSVFDDNFERQYYFLINLDKILGSITNKILYIPKGHIKPFGLKGTFKIKYY